MQEMSNSGESRPRSLEYEEIRRKTIAENKQRMENLGIRPPVITTVSVLFLMLTSTIKYEISNY